LSIHEKFYCFSNEYFSVFPFRPERQPRQRGGWRPPADPGVVALLLMCPE
jgi:hypothetical protein